MPPVREVYRTEFYRTRKTGVQRWAPLLFSVAGVEPGLQTWIAGVDCATDENAYNGK